jgi:hypothetical protein
LRFAKKGQPARLGGAANVSFEEVFGSLASESAILELRKPSAGSDTLSGEICA